MSIEMIYQILSKWIDSLTIFLASIFEGLVSAPIQLQILLLIYYLTLIQWEKSNGRYKRNHSGS
jgi:hypothetical protein